MRRSSLTKTIALMAGLGVSILAVGCEQNSRIGEGFDVGESPGDDANVQTDGADDGENPVAPDVSDPLDEDGDTADAGDATSSGDGTVDTADATDAADGEDTDSGRTYSASEYEEFHESTTDLAIRSYCREASTPRCLDDRIPSDPGFLKESVCVSRAKNVDILSQLDDRFAKQKALDSGRQTYDAEAARACLEKLKGELNDDTPCEQFYDPYRTPLNWNTRNPDGPCERVFVPAVEEDGKCLHHEDCKSGLYCGLDAVEDQCWGRCKPKGGPGDACEFAKRQCEPGLTCIDGTCQERQVVGVGEMCSSVGVSCEEGLVCREEEGDEWRCRERFGPGQSCSSESECEAGTDCVVDPANPDGSDLICVEKESIPAGDPCTETASCESGLICVDNTCVEYTKVGQGEPCASEERFCDSGLVCRPASGPSDRTCQVYGEENDACVDGACGSGLYCRNGGDGPGTCQKRVGEGADCEPGACEGTMYCNSNSVCVTRVPGGALCAQKHCEVGVDCRRYDTKNVCGGIAGRCEI